MDLAAFVHHYGAVTAGAVRLWRGRSLSVRNPRYLLVRESWLGRRLRVDFHAVPAVLGQHKDLAEHFARCWRARVGGARLVFTRTGDGRRALLRARSRSFAAGFRRNVDALSVWR